MRLTDSRPNSPHISQLVCNDTLPLESGAAPVWRSRGQPGRPLLTIYCGREGPKPVSLRSTPRERFQLCRFAQLHLKRTLWHVGRFSCWWVSWPRAFKVWWRSGGTLHFDAVCGASLELFPELSIPSPPVHISSDNSSGVDVRARESRRRVAQKPSSAFIATSPASSSALSVDSRGGRDC